MPITNTPIAGPEAAAAIIARAEGFVVSLALSTIGANFAKKCVPDFPAALLAVEDLRKKHPLVTNRPTISAKLPGGHREFVDYTALTPDQRRGICFGVAKPAAPESAPVEDGSSTEHSETDDEARTEEVHMAEHLKVFSQKSNATRAARKQGLKDGEFKIEEKGAGWVIKVTAKPSAAAKPAKAEKAPKVKAAKAAKPAKAPKAPKAPKAAAPKKERAPKAAKPAGEAKAPRDTAKQKVIEMLQRPKGASIAEIIEATDWQPHTVRGFIAGAVKVKMGLDVESSKDETRGRVYRITTKVAKAA